MKEKIILRWVAAICILGLFCAAMADRPEPNAFLNKRASTVSQLVQEVRSDNVVADRYSRHFGKTKDGVVDYFGTLHLARLNTTGDYMIYSVDDQGIIKSHPQRLKAGTLVFADSSGNPILKASCGNALVPGSNAQTVAASPTISGQNATLRTTSVTTAEAEQVDNPTASIIPATPLAVQPIIPNQVETGNNNQGFALPAALAALGGGAAFLVGGGGGSGVPEPASIVIIVGAIAAYSARRRQK